MKGRFLPPLAFVAGSAALYVSHGLVEDMKAVLRPFQQPLQVCPNTPTSRSCWGQYSTDTNYYTTYPETGDTVEIWLSAEESTCNPDGYERSCMTFNGTMPGPPIVANWGDELVIHVTNNMRSNGTTVHWHGVRQLDSVQYDGVPGVTQCPIRPGQTLTYRYKATQYGTSWYHSHISLQYSEGLFGPLIFKGPATADYDEDLGALFLQDWSHVPTFSAWSNKEQYGITQSLSNLLINGTNTFDCSADSHKGCVGGGKKFQTVFQRGKKYLIRLINVATDSQFQFSIDGHKLKVIANDFVPIKPYDTDSVVINAAQRYDVIVEANAPPGDYWLRAFWVNACAGVANDHPEDSTGIVRYIATSTSDPTSVSAVKAPTTCLDEPLESLVPHMKFDVTNIAGTTVEDLSVRFTHEALLTWTINSSSLVLDWSNPTLKRVFDSASIFPTEYNVVSVDVGSQICSHIIQLALRPLTQTTETDPFRRRVGRLGNPEQNHGSPRRVSLSSPTLPVLSPRYRLTAPLFPQHRASHPPTRPRLLGPGAGERSLGRTDRRLQHGQPAPARHRRPARPRPPRDRAPPGQPRHLAPALPHRLARQPGPLVGVRRESGRHSGSRGGEGDISGDVCEVGGVGWECDGAASWFRHLRDWLMCVQGFQASLMVWRGVHALKEPCVDARLGMILENVF